jgi:hypothetical protein
MAVEVLTLAACALILLAFLPLSRVSEQYEHMRLVGIYSLEQDQARIAAMQKASLRADGFGLSPSPAVVGTPEWWRDTRWLARAQRCVRDDLPRVLG